jgi:hypothetical protein
MKIIVIWFSLIMGFAVGALLAADPVVQERQFEGLGLEKLMPVKCPSSSGPVTFWIARPKGLQEEAVYAASACEALM